MFDKPVHPTSAFFYTDPALESSEFFIDNLAFPPQEGWKGEYKVLGKDEVRKFIVIDTPLLRVYDNTYNGHDARASWWILIKWL